MNKNVKPKLKYDLKPAELPAASALLNWFQNADELLQWAGPRIKWPLDLNGVSDLIKDKQNLSFCMLSLQQDVVGFGQIQIFTHQVHFGRIAVNPKRRGEGLSTQLMTLLSEKAKALALHPIEHASLWVYRDNQIAQSAYAKLGFVKTNAPRGIKPVANCDYLTKAFF